MDIRRIESRDELKTILEHLSVGIDRSGKKVLGETSLMAFRGVPIYVGYVKDEPVTLNATTFGKRKPNAWSPYMNGYIAFTKVDKRRCGHALELVYHVKKLAVESGCLRVKGLAGTVLGLRFHQRQGDQFWAWTDRDSIMVDSPLVEPSRFPPNATPIAARKWTNRLEPFSSEELEEIVRTKTFGYDK